MSDWGYKYCESHITSAHVSAVAFPIETPAIVGRHHQELQLPKAEDCNAYQTRRMCPPSSTDPRSSILQHFCGMISDIGKQLYPVYPQHAHIVYRPQYHLLLYIRFFLIRSRTLLGDIGAENNKIYTVCAHKHDQALSLSPSNSSTFVPWKEHPHPIRHVRSHRLQC